MKRIRSWLLLLGMALVVIASAVLPRPASGGGLLLGGLFFVVLMLGPHFLGLRPNLYNFCDGFPSCVYTLTRNFFDVKCR